MKGVPPSTIPQQHLVKGSYFSLTTRAPFTHLIYPVPEPGHAGTVIGGTPVDPSRTSSTRYLSRCAKRKTPVPLMAKTPYCYFV